MFRKLIEFTSNHFTIKKKLRNTLVSLNTKKSTKSPDSPRSLLDKIKKRTTKNKKMKKIKTLFRSLSLSSEYDKVLNSIS